MTTLLWNQCLKVLERELSGTDFNTWIRPLHAIEEAGSLRLFAPNVFVMNWIRQHFYQTVTELLARLRPQKTPVLVLQVGSRHTAPRSIQSVLNQSTPVSRVLAMRPTSSAKNTTTAEVVTHRPMHNNRTTGAAASQALYAQMGSAAVATLSVPLPAVKAVNSPAQNVAQVTSIAKNVEYVSSRANLTALKSVTAEEVHQPENTVATDFLTPDEIHENHHRIKTGARRKIATTNPISREIEQPAQLSFPAIHVPTPNNTQANAPRSRLNTHLTFTQFVVGNSNQLARAASEQMAEHGGYNPLYLYGNVGLGKTHLLHAVGHQFLGGRPSAKVAYIHAENFVAEWIKALQNKKVNDFKKQYRSLDLLLIDDIQFFSNKNQSQEEFLHTFNYLIERQKRVVLAGNCAPIQLNGIDERLKSRFSSGLAVAIQVPDYETRLAILQTKAQHQQLILPLEICDFIATHIQQNVRELEGAVHRIAATARFMQQPITLKTTEVVLQDLLSSQAPSPVQTTIIPTLAAIQKQVCDYFKISLNELCSRSRKRQLSRPRQIAMALAKQLTKHSLPDIGHAFGRDHTTVLHSCKAVEQLRQTDREMQQDYSCILKRLQTV